MSLIFGVRVPSKEDDVGHWLRLAEQARLQAERMTNADAKREMLMIAAAYRRLAEHVERTAEKARRE
jgi:pyruvate-formate lyase